MGVLTAILATAAVAGTVSSVQAGRQAEKASKAQAEEIRNQNRIAEKKEQVTSYRNRVQAIRRSRVAQAEALTAGVGAGIVNPGMDTGVGSTFAGATGAYQTQLAANFSFANQINTLNRESIDSAQNSANIISGFQSNMNRYQQVGTIAQGVTSGLPSLNRAYQSFKRSGATPAPGIE